jgi:hypothetical protein
MSSQQNHVSHWEHVYGILSGFFIAKSFWRFRRWRESKIPPFNEVMLKIKKPTDLFMMASRDAAEFTYTREAF